MKYTIHTLRDGHHFTTANGIIGSKETVIANLLESRRFYGLSDEEQSKIEQALLTTGRAHYDVHAYILVPLPYSVVAIKPSHGGFGEYEAENPDDYWGDESDLLIAMQDGFDGTLMELGVDELPEHVADIRGRIRNEPNRVFAMLDTNDELIGYEGINIDE